MPSKIIADLRSDTVTKPSAEMRRAIAEAEVGDDVLGDDPTVNRLQEKVAALLGKEAALYTPSGTMANQIAVRVQTSPGDELICHEDSHLFYYESGAPAALSGVSMRFLHGPRGQFTATEMEAVIRPHNSHFPPSKLVVVENTHNRGGGSVWSLQNTAEVSRVARRHGLSCHLDGARLMNACIAGGYKPADYARHFDTVSTCFSKGLGAPVGSALAGPKELITKARRFRKMFGGGMRQAGIVAAAAIYALDNNIERLAKDHAKAKKLAMAIAEVAKITIHPDEVDTNIVFFDIDPDLGSAEDVCTRLAEQGVLMLAENSRRLRAVTHLDVSEKQIDDALPIILKTLKSV